MPEGQTLLDLSKKKYYDLLIGGGGGGAGDTSERVNILPEGWALKTT